MAALALWVKVEGPCWTHDQIGVGLSNAYHEGERRGHNNAADLVERRYHALVAQKTKMRDFMYEFFRLVGAIRSGEL